MAAELVESSNLHSREFLKGKGKNGTNKIRIVFKNGRTYDYQPVPEIVWDKREFYASATSWFNDNLRFNKEVSAKEVK